MIKNTFPNKLRNSQTQKKKKKKKKKKWWQLENPSTNVHMVGTDLLRAFSKLFYLQFYVFSYQLKNKV